jgi:hypothetical protein
MEGNTPLPPHSMEESLQQSEVQDTKTSQEEVPTPLENFELFKSLLPIFQNLTESLEKTQTTT